MTTAALEDALGEGLFPVRGARRVIDHVEAGVSNSIVRFMPSGEEKTTAQIWAESERVARWLRNRVGSGTSVAAFLTNTPACPAGIFGVWRSGNDLVSLPHPGRGANLETYVGQVVRMCELAQADLVLIDAGYQAMLPPLPVPVVTYQEIIEASGTACDTAGSGGLIQFTSGSIGSPKGVVLSAEALGANLQSITEVVGVERGDTACSWLPMSHDMGFVGMFLTVFSALGPAYGGAGLLLQTPESFLADPASWLQNCSDFRAMLTTAPNFAFELAVRFAKQLGDIDLSHLRTCITGAERVDTATLRLFQETFAPNGLRPNAICPAYGMAEASLAVTLVTPNEPWHDLALDAVALAGGDVVPATDATPADRVTVYVSNGRPVPRTEVRVLDENGRDTDRIGDVHIRGASMLTEYVGAELHFDQDGWFCTRDRGFLHDGELYLVGRADESIIVGGQNYYAADIEHGLENPLVRKGNLAAVPMQGGGYWLVAEPVGTPSDQDLSKACRELSVAAAKGAGVRPTRVAFIERGRMPKTPSGKLQRLKLRAALQEGELPMILSWPPKP